MTLTAKTHYPSHVLLSLFPPPFFLPFFCCFALGSFANPYYTLSKVYPHPPHPPPQSSSVAIFPPKLCQCSMSFCKPLFQILSLVFLSEVSLEQEQVTPRTYTAQQHTRRERSEGNETRTAFELSSKLYRSEGGGRRFPTTSAV